jgi:MFS family permease
VSGPPVTPAPPGPPRAPRRRWPDSLAPLRNRSYRWLFASNLAFFYGIQGQMVVRMLLAWELTDSKLALGYTSLLAAIPMVVISPFGGAIADRIDRRTLILVGQAGIAASEATILGLLLAGQLAFWHLLVGSFVLGCLIPLIMPARMALVVSIVGRGGLARAMALSGGGMQMMRIVAPALAGLLVAPIGLEGAYLVGVAAYATAFLCVLRVGRPPRLPRPERGVWADVRYGLRYVREHRPVLVLLGFGILPMFLAWPFQSLLVVFADEVWNVGERGFGAMQAAAGIGGVLGAWILALRGETPERLRLMSVSALVFGAFLIAFARSPSFPAALAFVLAADVFASMFGTLNNTAIQILIPESVRGRISGFLMMSFGLAPLGTLPMTAAAERFGAPDAVTGAALLLLAAVIAVLVGSPTLRAMDETTRRALEAAEDETAP